MKEKRAVTFLLVAGWVLAIAAAVALDGPVARLLSPYRAVVKHAALAEEFQEAGHFACTVVVAVFLVFLHTERWKAAALVLLTALVVGALRFSIAIAVGRVRPAVSIAPFEFHPLDLSQAALLHAQHLSFPSGHAALAFATAGALAHLLPKGRWLFFSIAALIGIERIAELAHYVSDVVAAALLGMIALRLSLRIHHWLFEPVGVGKTPLPIPQAG